MPTSAATKWLRTHSTHTATHSASDPAAAILRSLRLIMNLCGRKSMRCSTNTNEVETSFADLRVGLELYAAKVGKATITVKSEIQIVDAGGALHERFLHLKSR